MFASILIARDDLTNLTLVPIKQKRLSFLNHFVVPQTMLRESLFWGPHNIFWGPINPFHATGLFLYPLKTLENLWFPDVFRGYRRSPVAWNGLSSLKQI